ncbi:alpha/beta fold hydrolase [Sedimenticola selenatireducens]|uniref:alpha/beta fold hydrolase n=1 Tax=Sedimenticola selenatireducens TaxID=191960 RepID=UPI0004B2CC47|nr:alpha/beta hydrolase [Sedimenticola selenatireducens]
MSNACSKDDCNRVLLLHGIWMTGIEMGWLKHRLTSAGYQVERFRYPSLSRTPVENAQLLNRFIRQRGYDCLHLVAHSLGGLVLLNLFDLFPDQPPGRVVLLGSPVHGSAVARRLARHSWGRRMIGRAGERGLVEGAPPWNGERQLGVIAGTSGRLGIGRLLGGIEGESDGTVMLKETAIPAAADRRLHDTGHMGMLFSTAVAADVAGFLRNGHFPR